LSIEGVVFAHHLAMKTRTVFVLTTCFTTLSAPSPPALAGKALLMAVVGNE
jgi:hypothetical protein